MSHTASPGLLGRGRLAFVLGPCVLEGTGAGAEVAALRLAEAIAEAARRHGVVAVFKASFDKANRTRGDAFRGPGLEEGLRLLERVRRASGLPVLTDVHEPQQAAQAAEVVDVLQIPAFLCRQTDLLTAAGRTGKPVHIKKGQFLAPWDMRHVAEKVVAAGASEVWLGERGTSFGHGDLVVDMRGLVTLGDIAAQIDGRVVYDATHAVQQPGRPEGGTGGQRAMILPLARAAVAVGVDAVFAEVHPDPDRALSDAASQWPLPRLDALLTELLAIDAARRAR